MPPDRLDAAPPPPPRSSSTLLDLPSNIQKLRAQFFALNAPVTMPLSEFTASWRFLDNIYVKNQTRRTEARVIEYYWCRLWRKSAHQSRVAPEERKRKRTIREPVGCPCRVKAVTQGAMITFSRLGGAHNHEYSALEHKVTSGVLELAANEASKGYRPSEIAQILRSKGNGNAEALLAAGGSGLTLKDIHNVMQARRRSIPAERKRQETETETETDEREVRSVAMREERIREVLDDLHRKYLELESLTATWPAQARDQAINSWIRELDERTQVLRRESLEQVKNRVQPTMEGQTQTAAPQSSPVGPAGTVGPVGPVGNHVEEKTAEPSIQHERL